MQTISICHPSLRHFGFFYSSILSPSFQCLNLQKKNQNNWNISVIPNCSLISEIYQKTNTLVVTYLILKNHFTRAELSYQKAFYSIFKSKSGFDFGFGFGFGFSKWTFSVRLLWNWFIKDNKNGWFYASQVDNYT